jgi:hypothetical protein
VANGLTVDRLMRHVEAIHKAAERFKKRGLTLLAGSEVDILVDGRLTTKMRCWRSWTSSWPARTSL